MASYKKGQPANRSKAAKKRSYASRTPQARSYKKPKRVSESGMALGTVARTAYKMAVKYNNQAPSKGKSIGSSISGGVVPRTKATAKYEARIKSANKQGWKDSIKKGILQQPWQGKSAGPISTRMTKAPVKGKRKTASKPTLQLRNSPWSSPTSPARTRRRSKKNLPGHYYLPSRWKN
jgi:hypothetical protein